MWFYLQKSENKETKKQEEETSNFFQQCSEWKCFGLIMLSFKSRPQWIWLCVVYQATIVACNMVSIHWFMYAFRLVNGIQPIPSLKLLRWIIIQFSAGNVCGTKHNHHQSALHTHTMSYILCLFMNNWQWPRVCSQSTVSHTVLVSRSLCLSLSLKLCILLFFSFARVFRFHYFYHAYAMVWHSIAHSLVNGC